MQATWQSWKLKLESDISILFNSTILSSVLAIDTCLSLCLSTPRRVPMNTARKLVKGAQSRLHGLKSLAKLFKFVVWNPFAISPSLTILVPLWFIIISLMFFYLYKVLFSSFLQFNRNFVDAQNNSKYFDWAPLKCWGNLRLLWNDVNSFYVVKKQ